MTEYNTDDVIELLGEARSVSRSPKKETLMSFREGGVYMALKLVSSYDRTAGGYAEPEPRIVFVVNGKYIKLPLESDLFKRFGGFLMKVGEAVEGVEVRQPEIDLEAVKEKMKAVSACRS